MRIFVYGSLRHKQGNSHWMTNAQLLGDFSIDTSDFLAQRQLLLPR